MLLAATRRPVPGAWRTRAAIPGDPPSPFADWSQCRFAPRCPHRIEACLAADPPLAAVAPSPRLSACLRAQELPPFAAFDDGESRMTAAYRTRLGLLRRARAHGAAHVQECGVGGCGPPARPWQS